jgi:folate-dependent tRNA-U54 methylase TrmFO/GidA
VKGAALAGAGASYTLASSGRDIRLAAMATATDSSLENGKPTVRLDKLLRVVEARGLQLHLVARGDN